jgi:enoyl-CoA hydratase
VAAEGSSVRTSIQDSILLIRLGSDDGFPRLTRSVLCELRSHIRVLNENPNLAGAVITGTEKCFCAGAELTEVGALDATEALKFAARGQETMRAIEGSGKPVIAAISGFCMGGGFDLALACHIRLATPDAVFGHRGAVLGIMTGWGGTQRLPRFLGAGARSIAMELMATGRTVRADEALALKIVSKVVPRDEILDVARKLAGRRK